MFRYLTAGLVFWTLKCLSIKELGAWGEKSMYGKKFMGIKRTTVLIGKNQKVIKIWENVKVKDHVKSVLEFIKNLS